MNLRDLQYLLAVADHGHFGRAAEACHVSQPTLSTQIKKLEDYLGVQLVERANKPVVLTPVGEDIARRAREVVKGAADIVEVARAARDPLAGELRLGVIPTVGPYLLPHLVPELRKAFPNLHALLYEEQTSALLAKLRAGQIDAAIMAVPVDGAERFEQMPLFDEPFVLAVPQDHPLARRKTVELEDLRPQTILLLEEGHCLRDQALDVCSLVGAHEAREFRATSMETLRQMVASGAGVTLLPKLAAAVNPSIPNASAIELRPFRAPAPKRHIAVLWRRGAAREPVVKAMGELAADLPGVRRILESD